MKVTKNYVIDHVVLYVTEGDLQTCITLDSDQTRLRLSEGRRKPCFQYAEREQARPKVKCAGWGNASPTSTAPTAAKSPSSRTRGKGFFLFNHRLHGLHGL